ncbi:tectonic-1 [Polymixia lowei]
MAAFVHSLYPFGLLLLNVAATTEENSTRYDYVTDLFEDLNFTDIDNSVTHQFDFDSTTTTFDYSTTETPVTSPLSPDPLLLSGLISPVTDVVRLCPCDEQRNLCDINCCCDSSCSEEVALFTSCSVVSVSRDKKLCSQVAAHYSLGSTIDGFSVLHTSVQREINYDIFCIQSQNRVEGLSHGLPAVPTARNFDSLFEQFVDFPFSSGGNSGAFSATEDRASSGYLYGDTMATAGRNGERGILWLPAPGVGTSCVDMSPAAFLKKQSSRCSRSLVLDKDCNSLQALNMHTYTGMELLSGKNKDATLVAVEVTSVVQQSLEGTQTQVELGGRDDLDPILLRPAVCTNVVFQVAFVVIYNPAGEIVNVTASLVLGTVRGDTLPMEQDFHITFVQEGSVEVAAHSGNPGYVAGLPLILGTRTAGEITRSTDPSGTLTILQGAWRQDCLRGPYQRSPVLFGLDMVSGCMLRMEEAANCSLVSQVLLDVLRGQNYPQYVAAFGASPLDNPLDWVPIRKDIKPTERQSCSIPLSLHLEVEWTKYGSLVNPQARIVSVKEVIYTNTSSLALLSGGTGVVSVSSSVSFVPVSAAALPGFRASPTLDAKLPFDFFFPFV